MEDSRSKILIARARDLRHHSTDAEKLLWQYLRARRLMGCKFRRQVVIEPYIVDFLCVEAGLIVEADGGQHSDQKVYDDARSFKLERMGYRVLRFWNNHILCETSVVLGEIYAALEVKSSPSP